jgi:TonB family protein
VPPAALDVLPKPIDRVLPIYPEKALKGRVRGVVVLRVMVSETGAPTRADVEKGVRVDVNAAAVSAAMQWRFEPGRKNGRAVPTSTTVTFSFEGIQFARTPLPMDAPVPTATPRRR